MPAALTGSNCNAGGILGTRIPSYNPAFTGNVRINGNYGSGNLIAPAAYTVGNLLRTGVYGLNASFNSSIDMSLRREFKIYEGIKLAFQADAFNVNNTVHFGAPGLNPDQASFGTVTS